jgi:sugar lactone lactonase YvrE
MKKNILIPMVMLAMFALPCAGQSLTLKWKTDTLLRVPESVLLDAGRGVLFISNINGKSGEKDGNGFISQLSLDGKIQNLQWVTGLDAPKGMGLYKNNLYVADLTRVVIIDSKTGTIAGKIDIEGAQFLNDVTVDKKGNVYVSDSATGKIHLLKNNKAEIYFESPDFKRINGLLALNEGLYIADAGNGINYKLSADKQLTKFGETAPGADGVVAVGNGDYIVSSWGGEVYFINAKGESKKMLDTKDQKLNSADVDYHANNQLLYVPTFNGNCVMAYEFKK